MPLVENILRLKAGLHAVILAHYYTRPEVQAVADFVGDSLALSQQAATTDARVILFAGVDFMAQTAKILSPGKIVLLPAPEAGCSLAESCPADRFEEFCKARPECKVITYVNTTAAVKALTDVCCTSSNALQVVESFPEEQPLIFAPDKNLGDYIRRKTGRKNIVLWDGVCHVHEGFSAEKLRELREQYPDAKVLAHPECSRAILDQADHIGSTAALLAFAIEDPTPVYIVATEPGILYQMQRAVPRKTFVAALKSDGSCNECEYMKMVTLENIHRALQTLEPQVEIDPATAAKARKAIEAMLESH